MVVFYQKISKMPKLHGQVCIVTGASRGIGKGIALQLVECGATCYITGRNIETLQSVGKECEARHCEGKLIPVECDHGKDEEVTQLFARVEAEQCGRLDLLVNNAFQAVNLITENTTKYFWDLDPFQTWDEINNVGLRNNYICATLATRLMVPKRKGLIINIGSFGGLTYLVNPVYGIGKCGNDRMASDCSVELKDKNVAFLSLWPSAVRTELMMQYMQKLEAENHPDFQKTKWIVDHGESPEYVGKCVSHLLVDKNIMKDTGKILLSCDLASKYNFVDVDGSTPISPKSFKMMAVGADQLWLTKFIPSWLRVPTWLFKWLLQLATVVQIKDKSKYE
uniref:Dehydrogenase/reductase SDR family member 1-like n=1 Tax=Phallusia mammillata TaxID=59560 RepID=A0A6F9DBQ0_9ASCI|nr:dehydrogenase/reductase SDR family member 1-like [Phallusia mammillata]